MTKLFLGGFPLSSDEMALARLIAPHGNITTIKIVRDRQTGKCKGYAFIEMESFNAAENVVRELNGMKMEDRELTVKITEETPASPKPQFNKPARNFEKPRFSPRAMVSTESQPAEARAKRPRRPRV